MPITQELATKAAEADAALGVAHEALMQAQGLVTAPPEAVTALEAVHTALDVADDKVEAIGGLVGAPQISSVGSRDPASIQSSTRVVNEERDPENWKAAKAPTVTPLDDEDEPKKGAKGKH